MTNIKNVNTTFSDGAQKDAFARLRVSNPTTLFDSKQLWDSAPLFWDDQEIAGGGTTTTYNASSASTTISVAADTLGTRLRQTFMRFNYASGKSQQILMTATVGAVGGGTGIQRCVGQYDDANGIFFRDNQEILETVVRSSVGGTTVDTRVIQANWNLDKLDGTGKSGYSLDPTKAQILVFDYEWLGVGRVRFGFVLGGEVIYCNEMNFANTTKSTVYMSTPNNPLRYEIINDGNGPASDLQHICATVISEGGSTTNGGILRHAGTGATHVNCNVAGTLYALVGIRLKSDRLDAVIKDISAAVLIDTADNFEWILVLNPTVAGTFTYNDQSNSSVQIATGALANSVTNGTHMRGGLVKANSAASSDLPNARRIGAAIDGTPDELVLCARPFTSNADIHGALNWRELT